MQTYEIETLPRVKFAHVYHADTYFNTLLKEKILWRSPIYPKAQ